MSRKTPSSFDVLIQHDLARGSFGTDEFDGSVLVSAGPRYFITQIGLNFAIQKEIRKARREQYLENQRLEKEGMDVPVVGLKVSSFSFFTPSSSSVSHLLDLELGRVENA